MASPTGLSQRWLLPLLFVALAILVTLMTLLTPNQQNTEPLADRSIYNSAPTGYRAWYLASKQAGLPLLVWQKSFDHLNELPVPATMLIVEPYTMSGNSVLFGEKDVARLMQWVTQGNTLVLLDNFKRFGSSDVRKSLSLRFKSLPENPRTPFHALTLQPNASLLADYIHQPLLTDSHTGFALNDATRAPEAPANTVLLENRQHIPLLIQRPCGKGSLILGTTGDLAANRFLHQPANDNYQFLSNLLAREQKPIVINEFIHGYMETGDLLSYYQKKTPLGPMFGQLALAFIVLLWLSFVRWTPKPAEAGETLATDTSSGLEAYIQSLAGIYTRTQASPLAVEPLLQRIDSLLRRKFRVSLEEDALLRDLLGTVLGAYSNKAETLDAALEALQKAKTVSLKQEKLPARELLRLVQQLTTLEERLRHYGQQSHARHR